MKAIKALDIIREMESFFKGTVQINKSLCGYTSIKIGGIAALFLEPQSNIDLGLVIQLFKLNNIPFRVIGNGTNLLIDDGRLEIAVIKLSSLFFKEILLKENVLYLRGGVTLAQLLNFSIKNGISGFEFLAGIPGTVGGALVMNAGVRNSLWAARVEESFLCVSDTLIELEVMDGQGEILKLTKSDAGFVYRGSKLNDLIVLGASFKIKKSTIKNVAELVKTFLKKRKMFQPKCSHSAGCVFKNPPGGGISAGELIEKSELKGWRIGQAQVSEIHANFIINQGKATFSQVCELMDFVQSKVNQNFGVKLKPEIEIWNEQGL